MSGFSVLYVSTGAHIGLSARFFLHVYHINSVHKKDCAIIIKYSVVQMSNRGTGEVK